MKLYANPLNSEVLQYLAELESSVSEYQLLTHFRAHPFIKQFDDPDANLKLFQQHFVLMNSLYQLDELLMKTSYQLTIHALAIELCDKQGGTNPPNVQLKTVDPLRSYYLNWQQLQQTGANDVKALLNSFWQRFNRTSPSALAILDLPPDASRKQIRQRYQTLALTHHPDRGGNVQDFQEITQAYEKLKH